MGDGEPSAPRVAATAAGALAVGSLAVGPAVPWLTGALAVAAVVVFRLARRS
ncbi:hypothetical protein [Umezawaea sp. NPDC059074]|uniref:hypothetical protein n=1 Tax=Umezawaea sp. NPDC059074 TaxID=3346716 RepID=UPI003684FFF2